MTVPLAIVRALRRRLAATVADQPADAGFVMVLVVGSALVLMLAVSVVVEYAALSVKSARREQDYLAALSAAQAGVDDYLSRLNANSLAWTTVELHEPGRPTTHDRTGRPLRVDRRHAGRLGADRGRGRPGRPCPARRCPRRLNCARFHYDADTTRTLSAGPHHADVDRQVQAGQPVGPGGGPAPGVRRLPLLLRHRVGGSGQPLRLRREQRTAQTSCSRHFWDVPPRDTSYCSDIYFTGGDTLDGPVHTNDALLITGTPTFNGAVSTAYPRCAPNALGIPPATSLCYRNGGSAAPVQPGHQLRGPGAAAARKHRAAGPDGAGHGDRRPRVPVHRPHPDPLQRQRDDERLEPVHPGREPRVRGDQAEQRGGHGPGRQRDLRPQRAEQPVAPAAGDCAAGAIGGFPQSGDANYSIGAYDCRAGTVFVEGQLPAGSRSGPTTTSSSSAT